MRTKDLEKLMLDNGPLKLEKENREISHFQKD